jgi:large subunit ribosomal protein L10
MRAEKQYLIDEVSNHLKKSDYVILTNFTGASVQDVADLRAKLDAEKAEFHVIKNSSLRVAAKALGLPDIESVLTGPTALIVGGKNSPGVAKILKTYFKDKQKMEVKAGVLSKKLISAAQVQQLADMPSLDSLRAQFLGLVNQPGTSVVRLLVAAPSSLLNVLQAKAKASA